MMMNCGNVIIEQLWGIVVLLFSAVRSSNEKVRVPASLDVGYCGYLSLN